MHLSHSVTYLASHILIGFCYFFLIWASLVAQLVKNLPAVWETWVQSLGWEDPLEEAKATHSSILAWRIPWTIPFSVFMWFICNTLNAFVPICTLSCLPHPDRFFKKNIYVIKFTFVVYSSISLGKCTE